MAIASHLKDGVLPRGMFKKISEMLGVNRILKNNGWYASQALSMPDAHFLHSKNRGRTHVCWPDKTILDHAKSIPILQWRMIKDLAHILGMSIGTTHKLVKEDVFQKHSSALKPLLTEENKLLRIAWCS